MPPLRLFADRAMTDKWAYIPLLYPFFGLQVKDTLPYQRAAFEKHGWDPKYFTLVEKPEGAEFIVFPHEYFWAKKNRPDLIEQYITFSKKHGVPLLVDALGDPDGFVDVPDARVMRNNQYRYELDPKEVTTPYAVEDLLESYCEGIVTPREQRDIPSVGFIGFTGYKLPQRVRTIFKELPLRIKTYTQDRRHVTHWGGRFWREWMMDAFEASSRVKCNFIKRLSYSGHIKTVAGDMRKNREEFVQNLLGSDYGLVIRGDLNSSQRFYEVLALGRVPVLIDSECVLPLEDRIDYSEFCLIIEYKDLKRAPEILADFHARLSPETYRSMQLKAREAYEKYFRMDSFSPYLVELLRTPVKKS